MPRPARRRAPVLFALLGAAVVIAGCGGAEPVAPPGPFPPRPADIDVSRLDPCELVTPGQAESLAVSTGRPAAVPTGTVASPGCAWSDFDEGFNFTAQTVPTPASESVGAPGTVLVTVGGFGAVQATDLGDSTPICQLVADVADNGSIRVQAQSLRHGPDGMPRAFDQVCPRAAAFAEVVMENATRAG